MSDDIEIVYWDACIFYEYLNEEQQDAWKKQGVVECLEANKERLNRICTSAVTHVEVFPVKLGSGKEHAYWKMFDSLYFYDIPIDRNTLQLAREIRNFYFQPPPTAGANPKIMGLGDAIHLATAIIQEVDVFHTRDGKKKGGTIPLLGLPETSPGGKICGLYDLRIISPVAVQGVLAAPSASSAVTVVPKDKAPDEAKPVEAAASAVEVAVLEEDAPKKDGDAPLALPDSQKS